jgi:hypothetical protein
MLSMRKTVGASLPRVYCAALDGLWDITHNRSGGREHD